MPEFARGSRHFGFATVTSPSLREAQVRIGAVIERRRAVGPNCHQAAAAIIAPLSVHSSRGGRKARRPVASASVGHPGPEARVRRHPTAEHQGRRVGGVGRRDQLVDELVDHRLLERRRDVGDAASGWRRTWFTTAVFSPANEKSGSPGIARGNRIAVAVTGGREPVDGRPTGVPEPEEARHLVERLAGGVVDRLAGDRGSARAPPSPRPSCGRPTR